jgi:hypothetical protein
VTDDAPSSGPGAVDPEPPPTSSRSARPWYFWVALGVLVAITAIVVAFAVRPTPQDDYDDAVRDRFLAACTARGGDPVRETCMCFYDRIVAEVPFDRFELLDETLAIQTASTPDEPLQIPDDMEAMLDDCVAEST